MGWFTCDIRNNAIQTTLLAVAIITVVSLMFGFLGALVFKRYRIEAVDNTPEFEGTTEVTSEKEAVKTKGGVTYEHSYGHQ